MAKTTRKNETSTMAAKPAARRKPAVAPETGARKVSTRRRTTAEPDTAPAAAVANDRAARADRPVAAAPVPEPTHDEIAERAYYVFRRRGATNGHAAHDWFQARAELLRERGLKG